MQTDKNLLQKNNHDNFLVFSCIIEKYELSYTYSSMKENLQFDCIIVSSLLTNSSVHMLKIVCSDIQGKWTSLHLVHTS